MNTGPLVALVALVAGSLIGERLGAGSGTLFVAAGVAGLVLAWCTSGGTRVTCAAVALASLGCGTMQRAVDGQVHHAWVDAVERGDDVTVEGTLASDPSGSRFRVEAYVRARRVDRTLLVRSSSDDATRLRVLEAGDRVVLQGRLAPLVDASPYDRRARQQHAVAVLADARLVSFAPAGEPLAALANAFRDVVTRGSESMPPTARALARGFVLGDTRGVPDDVADAYRDSGLTHLLAVSGQNVAFALALVGPLLRRLPLAGRSALALLTVLVFATATRFEPSVVRASALAAVTILATFAGRPTARVRALVVAVVAVLLVDPFLVHSVGFRLSAAASAGIVLLAEPIASRLRGPRPLREAFAVSCAAQAGVAPVLLVTFGELPLLAPVANLLAAPAAEALGVVALPALLAAGVVAPLGPIVAPVATALVGWVTLVARAGAAVPLTVGRTQALVLAGIGAVATLARRARRTLPAPAPR